MVNACLFKDFPAFAEHVYSTESEFYRRENIPFPCINLGEDGEAIHVRALMPGVSRTSLRLTLGERSLIIEGELPPTPGRYSRQERFSGPFRRVAPLTAPVRRDAVTARLRDGILDMILPKLSAGRFPARLSAARRVEGSRIYQRARAAVQRRRIRPATDIVERPEEILVLVNVPGVAPADLHVEADHRCLHVRSLCDCGGPGGGSGGVCLLALEFVDGGYEMKMALPPAQDIGSIKARLKDGVLSVLLPRRRAPAPRVIPIATDED